MNNSNKTFIFINITNDQRNKFQISQYVYIDRYDLIFMIK